MSRKIVVLKADGTWTLKPAGKKLGITAAAFAAIQEGMSYAETVAIIGKEGEIQTDSTIMGTRTFSMKWAPEKGFASLSLMFQADKLYGKSQFGLK